MPEVAEKQKPVGANKKANGNSTRPDEKAFREKVEVETKKVNELKGRLQNLRNKIEKTSGGKEEYQRKKTELRVQIDEINAKLETLESERKTTSNLLEQRQTQSKAMRQQVHSMKRNLGVSTEEEVTRKIKTIEDKIMTTTMPLKDEKKLLAEIHSLRSQRTQVSKYAAMAASLTNNDDTSPAPVKVQLDSLMEDIRTLRNQRQEIKKKMNDLSQDRIKATGPLRETYDEIEKIQRMLEERIATRQQIYQMHNAEMRRWHQQQEILRAQIMDKVREDKARKESENAKKQLMQQLDKMEEVPLESDILLVEQTMHYVKKLVEDKDTKSGGCSMSGSTDKVNFGEWNEEGITLLPKNQRTEEFYYAPHKAIAGKKNLTLMKKSPKLLTFKHDIGTLSYFEKCGVSAPVTEHDLELCLEQLEAKLVDLKLRQEKEAEKMIERKKEVEAQLAAIDSNNIGTSKRIEENQQKQEMNTNLVAAS